MPLSRTRQNFNRYWLAAALVTFSATSLAESWWQKNKDANEWQEEQAEAAPEAPAAAPAEAPAKAVAPVAPAKTQEVVKEETPKTKKRVAKKKKKSRKVASEGSSLEYEASGYRMTSDFTLTVGVIGGISSTSIAGTSSSSSASLVNTGVSVDLSYSYFGLEVDGNYSFAGSGSNAASLMGGMGNLKGQIPFYLGSVLVKPKAGVGFGLVSYNQSMATDSLTSTASGSMSGLYATAGLDIVPTTWLMITVDYSTSIGASSSFATTSTGTTNSSFSEELEGSSFSRIRAGVNVFVFDHFYVGAQYALRTETWNFTGAAISQSHSQILGVVGYQF